MKHLLPTILVAFVMVNTVLTIAIGVKWVDNQRNPASAPQVIRIAAERNGIEYGSDEWFMLLAINKAEGNVKGCEFGIMNPEANTLDKQAGWCASSIVKGKQRWIDAGKPEDFITHFGRRYCPPDDHPLNANWVGNVTYWAKRLETK